MFIQNMVYIGFYMVWVLYFGVFVLYTRSIVKEGKETSLKRDFSAYTMRMYAVAMTNVFIAISLVIMPLVAMIVGIHVYWIMLGLIYTMVIHYYYLKMMMWGEVLLYRHKKIERKPTLTVHESHNYKVLYRIIAVVVLVYFIMIAFNAFDILPLLKVVLPPIMPMYFHIIVDFLLVLGIFLLSTLLLYVVKKRLGSMYQKGVKEQIYKEDN